MSDEFQRAARPPVAGAEGDAAMDCGADGGEDDHAVDEEIVGLQQFLDGT